MTPIKAVMANNNRINFCLFLYKNSVNAVNHTSMKNGSKEIPRIKYKIGFSASPVKTTNRKETLEGYHGVTTPIQVIPTSTNVFCLYSKYFEAIFNPTIIEIITIITLNNPETNSTVSNSKKSPDIMINFINFTFD